MGLPQGAPLSLLISAEFSRYHGITLGSKHRILERMVSPVPGLEAPCQAHVQCLESVDQPLGRLGTRKLGIGTPISVRTQPGW